MPTQAELQQLVDKNAIREVIETYGRSSDRWDEELFRSMFWDDAIYDHGTFVGPASDLMHHSLPIVNATIESTYHTIGNIMIGLDGDIANTESYLLAVHVLKAREDQPAQLDVLACRLIDRFERRHGEWRIARRVMVRDWRHRTDLLDPLNVDAYKRGTPDSSDWVYRLKAAERVQPLTPPDGQPS